MRDYENRKFQHKYYRSLIDRWKRPYEKKQLYKARMAPIKAARKVRP